MPNKNIYLLFLSFLCLNCSFLYSQSQTSSSKKLDITNAFERYFELERENIHVQLDKNLFITNESIWFKGYVYNTKLNLPFYATTNVYVQLIDESGTIVTNQLLYSMSGFFSGKINLNKQMKSGYYYLQFYTNWMNNFEEDESFIHKIKIKNSDENEIPLVERINPKRINAEFYPEGGNYITNVSNTVAVKITDINGKSIPNCLLEIHDGNNVVQKSISINSFGMGKFEFVPNEQNYKAVLVYKDRKFEYNLPVSQSEGISLELNNYIFDNKTLVKINYNKSYEEVIKNKTLYLAIQKNEKSNIIDIKTGIDEFFFSNELLFNGVNSIRIIDSEMNEIAQRLLFKSEVSHSNVNVNTAYKNNDKIDLSGNSNWYDACISVAILPSNTKLITDENSVTTLALNSFLNEKLLIPCDYFNEINRPKKYELDLMMLTQKNNKYDWNKIKNKPIGPIYTFEKGLDIKGTINNSTADLKKCRIQLKNIISDVIASTDTIKNNEFFFKNTTVTDSLLVTCHLIDKKDRSPKEMSYYLTILNKNKKFNKNYFPIPHIYPDTKDNTGFTDIEVPRFDGDYILLKEVEIKTEKSKLRRLNQSGNSYLRGYKVGVDVSDNTDVLSFIEQNGFTVNRNIGSISITGRSRNSFSGPPTTPVVYIDGRQLMNFEELYGLRMPELDEIYINATAIVSSINNNQGIIRMYRKLPSFFTDTPKNKPKLMTGGFETIAPFKNADYLSENSIGFENLGLIHWIPWILTDDKGNLKFTIPNKSYKNLKILIEGLTLDGKIISEIREVNVE